MMKAEPICGLCNDTGVYRIIWPMSQPVKYLFGLCECEASNRAWKSDEVQRCLAAYLDANRERVAIKRADKLPKGEPR